MEIAAYLLFSTVFIYTTLWTQINLFWSGFGRNKTPITVVHDDGLKLLIKQKTDITVDSIKIAKSKRPFGMMIGIPARPQLILSKELYDTFTKDETEYVVLHEVGHYVHWHSITELLAGMTLFVLGIVILGTMTSLIVSIPVAILLSLIFGISMIRLGRLNEYKADTYSVEHMTNPQGMIAATNMFRNFYGKSFTENDSKLVQFMFYRGNPYNSRIKMAEREIEKRK